jgi:hypothetical protein
VQKYIRFTTDGKGTMSPEPRKNTECVRAETVTNQGHAGYAAARHLGFQSEFANTAWPRLSHRSGIGRMSEKPAAPASVAIVVGLASPCGL